jgi:cobyrinic acid a,c-diamide synthase
MAALKKQGKTVQPFKTGPDFIDPGIHRLVTGRISRNLDLWMCGQDYVNRSLNEHSYGADAVVIEGVMGFYDGIERSTAALSETIGAKVILVIDAYGMAESAGAIIKGFNEYGSKIDGVIFNRVGSKGHYERLAASTGDIEPLGYLKRDIEFMIPERYLGLLVAEESPLSGDAVDALASAVTETIDIDRISELAMPNSGDVSSIMSANADVRIAVAKDKAFCFYYEDNFDLLRRDGAELIDFSPLEDSTLPEGIDALYIGGGYPEMHATALMKNTSMRNSIKSWVRSGRPAYAECGGLMYMGSEIDKDGELFEMTGALPYSSRMLDRRAALGYREAEPETDCMLGRSGNRLRGHEFHYSEINERIDEEGLRYNVLGEEDQRITSASYLNTLVSYTHIHLGSAPDAASWMVKFIRNIKDAG